MPSFRSFVPAGYSLFLKAEPAALGQLCCPSVQHVPLDMLRSEYSSCVLQTFTCPTAQGSPWEVVGSPKGWGMYRWWGGFFKWYSSPGLCKVRICLEKLTILPADHLWIYSMLNLEWLRLSAEYSQTIFYPPTSFWYVTEFFVLSLLSLVFGNSL